MTSRNGPVVVIGAGPYGLSAAAHLQAANVDVRVFGETMGFWKHHMPAGMLLRSSWEASRIADPARTCTLEEYEAGSSSPIPRPMPLQNFIEYGQWFQRRAIPEVDRRRVTQVRTTSDGFQLELEDGASMWTQRVVVAAGLESFIWRPEQFRMLPPTLVSHSSDHRDLGLFATKRVLVVGGGQSALESAALLSEAGANVEIVARAPTIHWLGGGARLLRRLGPARGFVRSVVYAPTDVGPPGISRLIAVPDLFRRLPYRVQAPVAYRAIRPAGSTWLPPRLTEVRFTVGRSVVSARPEGEQVHLALNDGTERSVDHVLLATGYRVDVTQYSFLASELVQKLRSTNGYPQLTAGFESSVPGLYFLGAPSARSFSPVMRFVSGTWYTAPALARYVARN